MVRTKQISRFASRGKAPRKQLHISGGKRKLDNDDTDGTDKKRSKLNTNQNSPQHENQEDSDSDSNSDNSSDSSSSSSSSSSYESNCQSDDLNDVPESMRQTMNSALESVKNVFNSNCSLSNLLTFTNKLHSITEANKTKLDELKYRKEALNSLIRQYKNELDRKHKYTYSWSSPDTRYFNDKIFRFIKENVKGLRFYKEKKYEEYEYYSKMHFTDWSVDIALKACEPQQQYKTIMDKLLSKYTNGMTDINRIISEYSHNGYRWYRIEISQQTDEEAEDWSTYAKGIMFTIQSDIDDYFRDIYYYKNKIPRSKRTVSFGLLREDLKCKDIQNMSDEDMACFIVAITKLVFDDDVCEDEDWIVEHHK